MGATKKYMVSMYEQEYAEIPIELRLRFLSDKVIFDDYEEYKEDVVFQQLYKAKKKATKDLDKWKFDKRHNR